MHEKGFKNFQREIVSDDRSSFLNGKCEIRTSDVWI